jgi:hypothetical protein
MEELNELQEMAEVEDVVDGGPWFSYKCTINN